MQDNKEARSSLRRKMAEQRNSLSAEESLSLSQGIAWRLVELAPIKDARTIMVFAAIDNEVNLQGVMEQWLAKGKTILLPRVEDNGDMEAVKFTGWEQTSKGPFGIREPIGEVFDPKNIDVVITPGLAFDYKGYRLGYGKGYYDRFLTRVKPGAFRCGVCYEFQVVEDIYPHSADIPVHWIVTDRSELVIDWDFF
ncbi:5-formyltetrahydrofolate cyclo-ligase [Syntrophomonas erecta]